MGILRKYNILIRKSKRALYCIPGTCTLNQSSKCTLWNASTALLGWLSLHDGTSTLHANTLYAVTLALYADTLTLNSDTLTLHAVI